MSIFLYENGKSSKTSRVLTSSKLTIQAWSFCNTNEGKSLKLRNYDLFTNGKMVL